MWRLHWRRAIFYSAITKRQHVSYIGKAWLESLGNVSLAVCVCLCFTHASACTLSLGLSSSNVCHSLRTITARALSSFQRVHARETLFTRGTRFRKMLNGKATSVLSRFARLSFIFLHEFDRFYRRSALIGPRSIFSPPPPDFFFFVCLALSVAFTDLRSFRCTSYPWPLISRPRMHFSSASCCFCCAVLAPRLPGFGSF